MTKKDWSIWKEEAAQPSGFDVPEAEPTKLSEPETKQPIERRKPFYMDWPESLKDEFDDFYY